MKTRFIFPRRADGQRAGWLALVTLLLSLYRAVAQPTIVSTVPANGATGVSTTAAVVFTFSEAMNPTATTATFVNNTTFALLTTSPVWSAGNTVLTCTPSPAFPANTTILWVVSGQDTQGKSLSGTPEGTFTTGTSGGGGGGSGTNQYTSFAVGQAIYYDQTSSGAPTLDTNIPYFFVGDLTLASNRAAVSATLALPSGSVSNLTQNPVAAYQFFLDASNTNQTAFNTTFGSGNYIFTVTAATSNQQVTVNLPAALAQPGAPTVTNYSAAQAVNPAQAFTLGWNPFSGGTATDFVAVSIGSVFSTASPGTSNALAGTTTSMVIPAQTLQPNTTYNSSIAFLHLVSTTNSSGYATAAFRETITQFNLITTASNTTPIVMANASASGHTVSFNVNSAIGQSLIIQYTTNLLSSSWQTLFATNSATGAVHVIDSVNTTNSQVFYRAKAGP